MMEFNSQICTTREQSERLLALCLKKETADMIYHSYGYIIDEFGHKERKFRQPTIRNTEDYEGKYDIPAWSLSRLLCMLTSVIPLCEEFPTFDKHAFLRLHTVAVSYEYDDYDGEERILVSFYGNGFFSAVVDAIEWLIKDGYLNKKYLENEMEEKA